MFNVKEKELLTWNQPNSKIAEQFRAIRTNIQFSSIDQPIQTLVITSPGEAEGKSTIVANLAISMCQQGQRVLLVDANVRRPSIHTTFKLSNTSGLVEVLQGTIGWKEAIQTVSLEGLGILTSGSTAAHPADWLHTQAMKDWLREAKEEYDLILFDCSPVLDFTDARMMAHQCDGVILVLRSGKTKLDYAIEAKRALEFSKAKVIGVILNEKE